MSGKALDQCPNLRRSVYSGGQFSSVYTYYNGQAAVCRYPVADLVTAEAESGQFHKTMICVIVYGKIDPARGKGIESAPEVN